MVVVVDREGRAVSRLRVGEHVFEDRPAGGRLLDTLQRGLGLPTPPPPRDAGPVIAAIWLMALIEAGGPRPLSWRHAARLHPLARFGTMGLDDAPNDEFATALAAEGEPGPLTWEALRAATIERGMLDDVFPPGLAARVAEWMDTGAYARWVLSELGDPLVLLPAALDRLTPAARSRVGPAVLRLDRTAADRSAGQG